MLENNWQNCLNVLEILGNILDIVTKLFESTHFDFAFRVFFQKSILNSSVWRIIVVTIYSYSKSSVGGSSLLGCFTLGESFWLLLMIFCLLPANCLHSFFVWIHFSVCFVYLSLCSVSWDKKCWLLSVDLLVFINVYF